MDQLINLSLGSTVLWYLKPKGEKQYPIDLWVDGPSRISSSLSWAPF